MTNKLSTEFIKGHIGSGVLTTVFLSSGIKIQGVITACDEVSILVESKDDIGLYFKHAIASIVPECDFNDPNTGNEGGAS